jgi:hypothetical protein
LKKREEKREESCALASSHVWHRFEVDMGGDCKLVKERERERED